MDLCRWADWTARLVCAAIIVRRCLVPWARWLGRRALCWGRYAVTRPYPSGRGDPRRPRPSACPCCGGVDFDGMAGRWAVVTGCTDGIGKEFALQLADQGMNVALVSRNANKLRDVAREIHDRHGRQVRTRVLVADFTSTGCGPVTLTETFESVRRGLAGLDVAMLVNNAGMANARPDRFADLTATATRDMVECNALAAVAMCRVAIPLMSEGGRRCRMLFGDDDDDDDEHLTLLLSTTRDLPSPTPDTRGGVVVNVGSVSSQLPFPMYAVYAATKSFLEKFSVELAAEYDETDGQPTDCFPVAVRCLIPGPVATKMIRMRSSGDEGPMTLLPGPRAYARHSLRSLGCHCACRLVRRDERARDDRETGTAGARGSPRDCDRDGVLASVLSAVFDSPSSPFSAGRTGVTTTGYLPHTILVMMGHAAMWTIGPSLLSNFVYGYLSRTRDRIVRREAEKAEEKAAKT